MHVGSEVIVPAVAVALAMDAVSVSITSGMLLRPLRARYALKIALFFGGFQALMPGLGWLAGIGARQAIADVDHWVAFSLLALIGGKMAWDGVENSPARQSFDPLNPCVLLLLSVATSLDALAVGFSFAFLRVSLAVAVLVIGSVTFSLSFLGVLVGSRFGHVVGKRVEVAGGLLLMAIGVKILLEHLG